MTRDEHWRAEEVLACIEPVDVLRVYEPDGLVGVKLVRFVGPDGHAVEVAISDARAADFLDIAQWTFQQIHADLADRRALDARQPVTGVTDAGRLGAPEGVADLDIYPCSGDESGGEQGDE